MSGKPADTNAEKTEYLHTFDSFVTRSAESKHDSPMRLKISKSWRITGTEMFPDVIKYLPTR